MEQTQSFSVGNLSQTSSLFVSESAFYLYACTRGKIYIERTQGCKFMNLRTHTHIYKTTSSPKGNDRSPDNKQVFLNSSQVSKRFFQLVKGS